MFQDFPHRGYPGGVTGAEVRYRSGDPEVLCTGGSLAGQLKLKWLHTSVVLGLFTQNELW